MKKHSWLNALENVSLLGLGAGTVASLLLQQMLYTTMPLSLLVVLGLINRRRWVQMTERRNVTLVETDQYLMLQVDRLQERVANLPTSEALNRVNRTLSFRNQELAEKLQSDLATVKQGLHQRVAALEQQGLGSLRQEMRQLTDRCNYLLQAVSQLSTDLGDISTQIQGEGVHASLLQLRQEVSNLQSSLESLTYQTKPSLNTLQEQVTRLERQFSKLPPPVDVSSVKREIGELIRIVADLVPRRDLSGMISDIQSLHQQQATLKQSIMAIETAALSFKRTFSDLPKPMEPLEVPAELNGHSAIFSETVELSALSHLGAAPSSVYPELQELATNYLSNLRSQLGNIQEFTTQLAQQQQQLREQLNQLPQTLDVVALQRQLSELSQRIPVSEGVLEAYKFHIQAVMQQELQAINQQLQAVAAVPNSELIFDFQPAPPSDLSLTRAAGNTAGSRAILEQALANTQNRLILIWPWADQCQFDPNLFQRLAAFLSRGKQLDIGWCYLAERQPERLLSKIQRSWMMEGAERNSMQDILHQLLQLKRQYPEQFQFKILGTSENFLVSDESFAVMGITDGLKTTAPFPELQIKVKTTDASVIQTLIQRFNDPTIAPEDLPSYWNRAVTHYDLGDKLGAIADYSHILSIHPTDAVAYNYRGLAHYELGDLVSALEDFTTSLHFNPHQIAAYCNRGLTHSELSDQWAAINDFTLALQTCPDHPIAYFYRGITQQKLDNHLDAIEDYSETIRLAPDAPVAYYYRGLAWQKLGNWSDAIADFELAAQFFWVRGSKPNAQKAMKNIAKLHQEMSRSPHPSAAEASPVLY